MRKWTLAFVAILGFPGSLGAQNVSFDTGSADTKLTDLLRGASLTATLANDGSVAAQDYVAAARADYRRLLTALYADGYYGGTISIQINGQEADQIAPLGGPSQIDSVAIVINPGPRFIFGQVQIAPTAPATVLSEAFATGQPALSDVIRSAVTTSITSWREAGYAKARIDSQQITAQHPRQELDATVALDPGPQLTFGDVTIIGNNLVRTSAIRRIAGVPKGAVYSPQAIADAERRLRLTGAFDSAALTESDTIGPDNTLPMTLQVAEARLRRLGFGLELSSVDGLKASTYWLHRNALGGAESFRVEAEVADIGADIKGIDYRLGVSLGIPAIYRTETDLLTTAGLSREDQPDYLLDKFEIESSLSRVIPGNKTAQIGIGLLAAHEETALQTRDYVLLTFPLSGTIDKRDNPTNATSGYFANADITPFISLKGSTTGVRFYGDGRIYRSFGANDRVTLAARGQIGSVVGKDAGAAPADYLFFSGGSATVRGYGFDTLGVEVTQSGTTYTTGGQSFAGAQVEARVCVTDNIGVVGFYDVGYVGQTSVPLTDGDWHAGTGIGVRYQTGIGPIRLDIATPASGDNAFGEVQIYIGIGQSF
jgi:translocation and assembly module TamA